MVALNNRASFVHFGKCVAYFFCKKNNTVTGHLDLEKVFRENSNCGSFHKWQLVILDRNYYIFKEHIAGNLTVTIIEVNARFSKCLTNPLRDVFGTSLDCISYFIPLG